VIRLSELGPDVQASVRATRERVARLHAELPANGLVVWTAGNVSERVPGADLFVIKPSGVRYGELSPDNMVVCTLEGEKIDDGTPASLSPSSDTAAVAYVFRHMPEVGGVVHTHSTYATAFAALHRPIPCVLTMMGDEFGGEIPVGPFAIIGDDSIGRGIVETLRSSRSPAVLMANHGPFTVGKNAEAAVKAAAMVEEVARTVAAAQLLGDPVPVAQEHIDALYERYQNVYGQH
jgi:L-ribulose-5-phosphate 4-epimerase